MADEKLSKKEKEEVEKEVNKRLNLYERAKKPVNIFRQEFKQQTATAIITAFSLLIALAWKDVITNLVQRINFAQGILFSAIVVTIFSVFGIIIVNYWAKPKDEVKK